MAVRLVLPPLIGGAVTTGGLAFANTILGLGAPRLVIDTGREAGTVQDVTFSLAHSYANLADAVVPVVPLSAKGPIFALASGAVTGLLANGLAGGGNRLIAMALGSAAAFGTHLILPG